MVDVVAVKNVFSNLFFLEVRRVDIDFFNRAVFKGDMEPVISGAIITICLRDIADQL